MGCGCPIRDQLLAGALYLRFRNQGTYYGFTRYSGIYLTHRRLEDDWFPRNVLQHHFDNMYFTMASLLLLMRASLLDFSRRHAQLTQKLRGLHDTEQHSLAIEDLRNDFLKLTNKYWFNEITAQEQGIEIFDLWSRRMDNKRHFDEVEAETRALHEHGQAAAERSLRHLTYLNVSAVLIAIIALILGALGTSELAWEGNLGWYNFVVIGPISLALGLLLGWFGFKKGQWIMSKLPPRSTDKDSGRR